jgi:Flp pilus assembly protein TadD
LTADTAKLKQDATGAIARASAAEKAAAEAKATADKAADEARAATERTTTEVARLKAENDRLTRDLDAVKELAELIKTPAGAVTGPASKPDPDRLAEQFFGDGLRAFHRGQYTDAESAFRKALQFRPNDARYHYLLGLTLWERKEAAGADAEFEKGRDLELAARPSSRAVSAALERIQGSARQAVDAYRP